MFEIIGTTIAPFKIIFLTYAVCRTGFKVYFGNKKNSEKNLYAAPISLDTDKFTKNGWVKYIVNNFCVWKQLPNRDVFSHFRKL